jgi:hypothetical protein
MSKRNPHVWLDGQVRQLYRNGKTTGEIAKILGLPRDVVAESRGRIAEARAERERRVDKGRPRPIEDETKVISRRIGLFGRDENIVSVRRITAPRVIEGEQHG